MSAAPQQPFVTASRISKKFGPLTVLNDVSLDIARGELIAILGPSGCGKTTLLRIIAGLEKQDSGQVVIDKVDVSNTPPSARGCGIVFQSYALFPNLTVEANIAFGMNRSRTTRAQRHARVTELLQLIGLPHISNKHPTRLSGGQQQRVALARALAVDPSILLLDEPLSALDAKVRMRLRSEIRAIQQRLGVTTILVTHDQEEALTMADRVVVMDHGRILQTGTPWQIYRNPNHTAVGDFVGSMNLLSDWTAGADGRLTKADSALALSYHGPTITVGEIASIAFRPEDARLISNPTDFKPDNCLPAQVQRVEFRGAFSRVYLTVTDVPIVIDAPFEQVKPFLNGESHAVHVHLPAEHLKVFRQDGTSV